MCSYSFFNSAIVLLYICSVGFLCMVCYDIPSSLERQIENTFHISSYKFEYLYSMYSIPNIVLAIAGGIIIDRYLGVALSGIVVSTIVVIGQTLFTVGGFVHRFWILLFARFIYGIGGDSILVVLNYYAVLWFRGRSLNLVSGLGMSMSRLGTAAIFFISNNVYLWSERHLKQQSLRIGLSFSTGVIASFILLGSMLALAWKTRRNKTFFEPDAYNNSDELSSSVNTQLNLKQIVHFPFKFWLIAIIFVSYQTCILTFVSCLQKLLMTKYKVSWMEADRSGSIFNALLALSGPIAGLFVDWKGWSLATINCSLAASIISLIMIVSTSANHYIPLVLFGLSGGSMFSCVLPLIARIVPDSQLGTAFGMCISISNLCLTLLNILAGYLLETFGPRITVIYYILLLSVGQISSIILWTLDCKSEVKLNSHADATVY